MLTLTDGADVEIYQSPDLIQAMAFDPPDGSLLVAVVSSAQQVDRGVWRVDPAAGTATQVVQARTDLDMRIRVNLWRRSLYVTPDGARIVALDCLDKTCEARVHDARTGSLVVDTKGLREEVVYGATRDALVGIFDCPSSDTCLISALDLVTGSLRPLLALCAYGDAALAGDGQPALISVGVASAPCRTDAVSKLATDTGDTSAVWSAKDAGDRQLLVVPRGPGMNYSAPPGWIMLGPGGGVRPNSAGDPAARMLDLTTGTVATIVLPAP